MTANTARILVVDDEPYLRELLVDALSSDSVDVMAAGSGDEAVELARRCKPDFLVTDLCLGDCTGIDVIDRLRAVAGDIPVILITGQGEAQSLTAASQRRPVEMMTKPLNIPRLQQAIRQEIERQCICRRVSTRGQRLRRLARDANRQRKETNQKLDVTCANLAAAYKALSGQMALQQVVIDYQKELMNARNDDDVFRALFRLFVHRSGPVFGAALVCDAEARLRIVGRFGVPSPDGPEFCDRISRPVIDEMLINPRCVVLDAWDRAEQFDASIRKYMVGVSILAVPLIPVQGELIGVVVLYRKGEQPFTDGDLQLAEMIAPATAVVVRRND